VLTVGRYIAIGGKMYRMEEEIPGRCVRLESVWEKSPTETPRVYKACSDPFEGLSCDCESWEFRMHSEPLGCKHTRTLVGAGLLPNPFPGGCGASSTASRAPSGRS
jgi:hypothetical protein